MKRRILITVLFSLVLQGFVYAQNNEFVIEGKIKTDSVLKGFIYLIGKNVKHDSVALINNSYRFAGTISRPGTLIYITWRDRPMAQQLKETNSIIETGSSQLLLEPGTIRVEHELPFSRIKVVGSKLNADNDSIRREIVVNKKNVDTVLKGYIGQHPNSWLSFLLLGQERKKFGPLLSDRLYSNLSPALKQYTEVTELGKLIAAMQASDVGKIAPEFTMTDPDGQEVGLSSYRGKYVLVDFWASWCAPCRAENPTVKGVYNKYKASGFDVLGVSLDLASSKKAWIDAIKQDGLTWRQVSDLKGLDSDVAVKYGVRSIPANFLIDPSGKIIATNLRGWELEERMRTLFNK